ncbi:MAG: protein kinase [bacterium]|nr:protein kinase [bacterium]
MNSGALGAGAKLGPYEILSPLGAGGMGEVYLAKDTRLDRTVAIKVLPPHVASNPDLRLRFEREAKAISSLNHPNICSLFDVGNQDGLDYLVMEHLQGETLAARLERGPLPTAEALTYATQIADALDKAHRQGLIHRDLKTLNVMLTKNGAKLLDFGLAKLQIPGVVHGMTGATHSTPLTGEGTIVGTLQYMSPEQLEGKEADSRSDIFSFGVVLYEMVTGKKPFAGPSQASLIASIMREDPRSVTEYQPDAPPALVRVIRQCLSKDPDERWQSARDLLHQLKWINEGGSLAGIPAPIAARRKTNMQIAWVLAGIFGLLATGLALLHFGRTEVAPQLARFTIEADPGIRSMNWPMLSPDGSMLAFHAVDTSGRTKVWIRRLDALKAEPIPGTDGARRPFWSPDSKQIAFMQNGQLMKVAANGGPIQLIAKMPGNASDGTWGSKDVILLDGGAADPIWRVGSSGGIVSEAISVGSDSNWAGVAWPEFLPDGEHYLYLKLSIGAQDGAIEPHTVMLGSLSGNNPESLFTANGRVIYDKSGYILSVDGQVLTARKFDPNAGKIEGEPIPVGQIATSGSAGKADFSVSDAGTLIYLPSTRSGGSELVLLDRSGSLVDTIATGKQFRDIDLSNDGKRLVYAATDATLGTEDIWTLDLSRRVSMRATFSKEMDSWPIWSPDGASIVYTSQTGKWNLYRKKMSVDGDGEPFVSLDQSGVGGLSANSWSSRDGSLSVVRQQRAGEHTDIGICFPGNPPRFEWIATTPYWELNPIYSPDGRFLAYTSDESGSRQLYVRQLDGDGEKWQISTETASMPVWRPDGKELFYRTRDNELRAVSVTLGKTLSLGPTVTLFETTLEMTGNADKRYDVAPDGERFLVNRVSTTGEQASFVLVQNWTAMLPAK